LKHSLGAAYAPVGGAQLAEGDVAGAVGRFGATVGTIAAPHAWEATKNAIPDQFKFDLYNSVFGEGAIDPKYKKEAGRGLSRAKLGPARRGQMSQPSADVHTETGIPKDVRTALSDGSLAKSNVLMTHEGQAKTIPIKDIIEENFGPNSIQPSPITGKPEVEAKTATNIPDAVNTEFSGFGNRLLQELIERSKDSDFKLSAADIEQMRHEGVIDPDFGKDSPNAPELSLNRKAIKVSGDLIKRAEDAVRRPDGQSALEYLNTHLSDLSHANKLLPEKLAKSRVSTTSPTQTSVSVGGVKTPLKLETSMKPPAGFGTGKLRTIAQTGLSSLLTKKPWWLEDSTQGLTRQTFGPNQPYGPPAPPAGPPPAGGGRGLLGTSPNPPSGAATAPQTQLLGSGAGQATPQTGGPPGASGAVESGAQPTHVAEGQQVAGFDSDGNLASGDLTKIFQKDGKWHGLVLDLQKRRAVAVPLEDLRAVKGAPRSGTAERSTNPPPRSANRPPGTEGDGIEGGKTGKYKVQIGFGSGGSREVLTTDDLQQAMNHGSKYSDAAFRHIIDENGNVIAKFAGWDGWVDPATGQKVKLPMNDGRPPGTSGDGVFGDTKTLGPEELAQVADRFRNAQENGKPVYSSYPKKETFGDHELTAARTRLGYRMYSDGLRPSWDQSYSRNLDGFKPYKRPPGTEPAGINGGPPIGPDEPYKNPESSSNEFGPGAHPDFVNWANSSQNKGLFPKTEENKYEVYHKGTGKNIGYADTPDDAHILASSHDYFSKGNTGVRETQPSNVHDMTPQLAQKKMGSWMDRLAGNNKSLYTTPEQYNAAKKLKFTMRADDDLGFDSPLEALHAILEHDDWADRWDVSPDTRKAGEAWKALYKKPGADVVKFPNKAPSDGRPPGTSGDGIFGDPKKKISFDFWHQLPDIERIASGEGSIRTYHGTPTDRANQILKEGFKPHPSGDAAAKAMADRYEIPWSRWQKEMPWTGYGDETARVSTAPYPVASRWAKNFPQGEVDSLLNAKARILRYAIDNNISFDEAYEKIHDMAKKKGVYNSYAVPDAAGLPDRMKPKNPGGVVFGVDTDVRALDKRHIESAQDYLEAKDKEKVPIEDILKQWNLSYRDMKIAPQNIKNIEPVSSFPKGTKPPGTAGDGIFGDPKGGPPENWPKPKYKYTDLTAKDKKFMTPDELDKLEKGELPYKVLEITDGKMGAHIFHSLGKPGERAFDQNIVHVQNMGDIEDVRHGITATSSSSSGLDLIGEILDYAKRNKAMLQGDIINSKLAVLMNKIFPGSVGESAVMGTGAHAKETWPFQVTHEQIMNRGKK
jgi:hypothetical protein